MDPQATVRASVLLGGMAILFYVFVFFPYFKFLPLETDTQPNAFIIGLIILVLVGPGLKLPQQCWALGLLALMAFALFLPDYRSFNAARGLFGYLSLFVTSSVAYICARGGYPLTMTHLRVFISAWFLLGLMQLLIDPAIGTQWSSAARSSDLRGVVSFGVEPGYYASMMIFFLLVLVAKKKEVSLWGLLCVIQIVFMAQSTVALAALAIPVLVYLLFKVHVVLKKPYFWVAGALSMIAFPFLSHYLEASRLQSMALLLLENPALLIVADASGNARAASIFMSIQGAFDNYLIPHGFNAYLNHVSSLAWEYRNIFWYLKIADRIMCGYGAALFEMGIFGLIVPVVITIAIFQHCGRKEWQRAVVLNVGTHAIMFTAMPLALPAIGFFIGYLLATRHDPVVQWQRTRGDSIDPASAAA